jgi:hypothetical protein
MDKKMMNIQAGEDFDVQHPTVTIRVAKTPMEGCRLF